MTAQEVALHDELLENHHRRRHVRYYNERKRQRKNESEPYFNTIHQSKNNKNVCPLSTV